MRVNSKSKLHIFLLIFTLFLLNLKCDKKNEFIFPYTYIYLELHIYTDLADLGANNTKIFPNEGYGGILLFKTDGQQYFAFDMACTHEIPDLCRIEEFESTGH